MKGIHKVIVENKRIRYEFELKCNITVISGDSATGKTTLVDMIRDYEQNGTDSGIELKCDKNCIVLEGRNWESRLKVVFDSIVFIDEGNAFVSSKEFASAIRQSNNYYVIVTREGIATLPYSVEEIYGIRHSGKYGALKKTYNEFYHLYGDVQFGKHVIPKVVITEDSHSGYQFFKNVCSSVGKSCVSAYGKSNIFAKVLEQDLEDVLVIADGAAFGSEIEKMMRLIENGKSFVMYLPESFEWLILHSNLLHDNEVNLILENSQDYIESSEYFSWEQFFTHLLVQKTEGNYLQYSKHQLNPVYLHESNKKKILDSMIQIDI